MQGMPSRISDYSHGFACAGIESLRDSANINMSLMSMLRDVRSDIGVFYSPGKKKPAVSPMETAGLKLSSILEAERYLVVGSP
jgi:hypothetical protein